MVSVLVRCFFVFAVAAAVREARPSAALVRAKTPELSTDSNNKSSVVWPDTLLLLPSELPRTHAEESSLLTFLQNNRVSTQTNNFFFFFFFFFFISFLFGSLADIC